MLNNQTIKHNIQQILQKIPSGVTLEAAAKTRSAEEVGAAIDGGISVFGYNYVQEAESIKSQIAADVRWHMIGHLQKNKVKKAVPLFDMIETVDSAELAQRIDKECAKAARVMDVLIEVNSGRESNKAGVFPEDVESLIRDIHDLPHIRIKGLMTMGPWLNDPEALRPYFRLTREIFDHLSELNIRHVEMNHLSMGMSDSYEIAIQEGATIVRLGTILFGPRSNP
jgi:pyridoxal phosphate enzyme (YggS family)